MKKLLACVTLLALLVACSPGAPSEGDIQTAIAQTAEAIAEVAPTNTAVPTETPTPVPTKTIRPIDTLPPPTNTPSPTKTPTPTATPEPTKTPEVKIPIPDIPDGFEEYQLIASDVVIAIPETAEIVSENRRSVLFAQGLSTWIVTDWGDVNQLFEYPIEDALSDQKIQEDWLKELILDLGHESDSIVFSATYEVPVKLEEGAAPLTLTSVMAIRTDSAGKQSAVAAHWFPAGDTGVVVSYEHFGPGGDLILDDTKITVALMLYGVRRNFNSSSHADSPGPPTHPDTAGALLQANGSGDTVTDSFMLQDDCSKFVADWTAYSNDEINQLHIMAVNEDNEQITYLVTADDFGSSASGVDGGPLPKGKYYLKIREVNARWEVAVRCAP